MGQIYHRKGDKVKPGFMSRAVNWKQMTGQLLTRSPVGGFPHYSQLVERPYAQALRRYQTLKRGLFPGKWEVP